MKKFDEPVNDSRDDQGNDLAFPVEPDFVSRPATVSPEAMLRRSEENLAWRNSNPTAAERRFAAKIDVEFQLDTEAATL